MNFVNEIKFIFFYQSFFIVFGFVSSTEMQHMKKIAVVGAGIGGTSCAHFLNELLGKTKASVHVYEPNKVGGRLALVKMDDSKFEAGGCIIHPRNNYMKEFVHSLGLTPTTSVMEELVGLFDGNHLTFVESQYKIISNLEALWRYGWDLFRLNSYLSCMLEKFDKIYNAQNDKKCFKTVKELLDAMDSQFPLYLSRSIGHGMVETANCHEKTVNELVLAANIVNYGQDNSIHQFVGSVSLAGAMDGLWAVKDGNYQVAEKLLQSSGAELHSIAVEKIEKCGNKYKLFTKHSDDEFDTVILATPIAENVRMPIEFVNFSKPVSVRGTYHRTVATFVKGVINCKFFGYSKPEDVPGNIFSINNTNFFNSISLLEKNVEHSIFKVFTQQPLTEEQLRMLFDVRYDIKIVDWLAYPNYSTEDRHDSFVLSDNLYYINAIEWAASAMEMSVIGARNVALLVYHDYVNPKPVKTVKVEL